MEKVRCGWCEASDVYRNYHDREWGVPTHDDQLLFEALALETQQAGLSWITILNKRDNYRLAFKNFDIKLVSQFDEAQIEKLVSNKGIIRHRGKIVAIVNNARLILDIQSEFKSFDAFIWNYVSGTPIVNRVVNYRDAPSYSSLSTRISQDLKKRGFKFVGPTTIYSFMQTIGMVNDHETSCYRFKEIENGNF
ncbi:MAG: DNA-3-methyladenine glycosylase I [Nonlabens sp.]